MATNSKVKARGEENRLKQDKKFARMFRHFNQAVPTNESPRHHFVGCGQQFTKKEK